SRGLSRPARPLPVAAIPGPAATARGGDAASRAIKTAAPSRRANAGVRSHSMATWLIVGGLGLLALALGLMLFKHQPAVQAGAAQPVPPVPSAVPAEPQTA